MTQTSLGWERPPPDSADIVIVGSGLAGTALARELDKRYGGRLLVIESGPDAGRDHYRWVNDPVKADAMWLRPDSDPHFWRPYHAVGPSFGGIAGLRRCLGGRSRYWHGVTIQIEPWALAGEPWPRSVVGDLTGSWHSGPSLYAQVDADIAAWLRGAPLSSGWAVSLGGCDFMAAPRAVLRSSDGSRWKAYSPIDGWPGPAGLCCDCHAVAIVTDDAAVTGLAVGSRGERRIIETPVVVLAAGTVENSRLMIQALAGTGNLPEPRLTGLVDKVAQGFVAAFDLAQLPAALGDAARAGELFLSRGSEELRSSVFLRTYVNRHGLAVFDCYCIGEQLPGPAGQVWCAPSASLPWQVSLACRLGPADQRLAVAQRAELQRLYGHLCRAAGRVGGPLEFGGEFGSADLPRRLTAGDHYAIPGGPLTYSFPLGSELHEAGTLPLGGQDVDEDGQARAVSGLFVAGPCTFPRTGAANPAMTILALAKRLGGRLAPPGCNATSSGTR